MYKVDLPLRITAAIRVLFLRAIRNGLTAQLMDALAQMNHHLSTDPAAWGDPQFHLKALKLTTYHRVEGPISIAYAVDDARKIVYLKSILPFPGGGLEAVP
jgi:hypothetical protein